MASRTPLSASTPSAATRRSPRRGRSTSWRPPRRGDEIERAALGKRATLLFNVGEEQRAFYGVVAAVRLAAVHNADRSIKYNLRVVPRLWTLKRKKRTRIFQKMRVPDIVTAVLLEAGIAARWQLTRAYPEREYVTQYEETDYRFVKRLLAEAGIYFYFPEGPAVDPAALAADAAVGAAAAAGSAVLDAVAGQAVGSLVGSVASMAETLIPGDTVICADDAACYPPLRGDDGAALAASTAAALAPAIGDVLGAGDGIAGAVIGGASAMAGTLIAGLTEGARPVPVLRFLANEEAAVSKHDKLTRFSLRNTVRSSAAAFRSYDPDRPMVRLQSVAVSTQPFPPSPFEIAAAAAAAAENAATTAEALVPGAAGALSAVDTAISTADAVVNEVGAALGQKVPFEVYEHHDPFLFPKWSFGGDEAPRILRQKRRRASIATGEGGCSDLCPGHRFALDGPPGRAARRRVRGRQRGAPRGDPPRGGQAVDRLLEHLRVRARRNDVRAAAAQAEERAGFADGDRGRARGGGDPRRREGTDQGPVPVGSRGHLRREQLVLDQGDATLGRRGLGPSVHSQDRHGSGGRLRGRRPGQADGAGVALQRDAPALVQAARGQDEERHPHAEHAGRGRVNELSFEDAAAREQVYLHAQRAFDEVVEQNHTLLVKNDELLRILGKRVDRVEKDLDEHVGGDHRSRVDGNRIDVVAGSADRRVSGMLVTRVEGRERRDVARHADLVYAEDLTTRVLGCMTTIVGKSPKKRAWVTHAEGTAELSGLDRVKLVSESEVVLTVGKSSLRITPDRIEIDAPAVVVKGKGGSMGVGDEGLSFKAKDGAQAEMGKKLLLKTPGASLAMDKEVKVDGAKILLNSPDQAKDAPPKDPDPPTKVELVDQDGKPVPYQRFVVKQDDGTEVGGKTDKDGKAEPDLKSGGKVVFPDVTMPGDESGKGDLLPHVVAQGEYLAKLAFVHGFDADQVWNDPKNQELKERRLDPNVLAPGDVLHIPAKKQEGKPIQKGQSNRYDVKVPTVKVDLLFRDGDQSLANEAAEVDGLGDPDPDAPRSTDGGGKLSLDVPVTVRELFVTFPKRERLAMHFFVGDVDPVSEGTGVAQRLVNLGYLPAYFDDDPDQEGDLVKKALAAFQAENGMEPTGEVDDATRNALRDGHQL